MILLKLYQKILDGELVAWDNSQIQEELIFSGLVCEENEYLKVFNLIYKTIFDSAWVRQNLDA